MKWGHLWGEAHSALERNIGILVSGSVVVESLCLESESRLESPVSESESSPSH